ncbi:MAG: rhomboid family intramembrane serine protease [Salinibacter sp.]|uniref:rhomboid family intramembrane serine protease n=1 Tax=Salinibacter sp. TaxID=2065818 RepID=UPI0035D4F888
MNDFKTWYYQQPSALRTIITINVVVWVLTQLLHLWRPGLQFVMAHFALHPTFPDILLEPWQLVTYSFMHAGLLHIGINMLLLFWVGREFERMHGSQQFWTVYLITAVSGGVLCLILSPFVPSIAGGMVGGRSIPVLGASASVLGVLTTVAILYPYKQIRLLFFGVVPLLWVVIGFLIIDALQALSSTGTAVAAHWGGALTGFLYAKGQRGELGLPSWTVGGGRARRSSSGILRRIRGWFRAEPRTDGTPSEQSVGSDGAPSSSSDRSSEVDRILDKISEEGYESLSDEEKRILYEASES